MIVEPHYKKKKRSALWVLKIALRIALLPMTVYGMIVTWPILNEPVGKGSTLYGVDAICAVPGLLAWLVLSCFLAGLVLFFFWWVIFSESDDN